MSEAGTISREIFRHRFVQVNAKTGKEEGKPLKPVYDFLGWLATQVFLAYAMFPFSVLEMGVAIHIWACYGFCGHVIMLALVTANSLGYLRSWKVPKQHTTTLHLKSQ